MGGFAGLFSLEGRPIDARELRTLAAACRRPAAAADYWVCGAMGLAVRHRDRVDSDASALGPVGRRDPRQAPGKASPRTGRGD